MYAWRILSRETFLIFQHHLQEKMPICEKTSGFCWKKDVPHVELKFGEWNMSSPQRTEKERKHSTDLMWNVQKDAEKGTNRMSQ